MKLCIVILAAGESSRLGYPKQTLIFQGTTLIERAIALASTVVKTDDILVVLGGYKSDVKKHIPPEVSVIENPDWKQGMGSTIKSATGHILSKAYDSILFLPSDLPLLEIEDLQRIIGKANQSECSIVYSTFEKGLGIPVLFKSNLFDKLLEIEPSVGAKRLILQNKTQAESVPIPGAAFDIDTQDDVDKLLSD